MKNATATSHGRSRLLEVEGVKNDGAVLVESTELIDIMRWYYRMKGSEHLPVLLRIPSIHNVSRSGLNMEIRGAPLDSHRV